MTTLKGGEMVLKTHGLGRVKTPTPAECAGSKLSTSAFLEHFHQGAWRRDGGTFVCKLKIFHEPFTALPNFNCRVPTPHARLDSRAKSEYCALIVNIPLYSEIKEQEAKHRRLVMKQRGSHSARARQQEVSLVGDGAKWQITNLRQVAAAMAKWA